VLQVQSIPKMAPNSREPSFLSPCIPLIMEEKHESSKKSERRQYISMELKSQAGSGPSGNTYTKYIKKFEDGSPKDWIELMEDFEEIWCQNKVEDGQDRVATIRATLRGECLAVFEAGLLEVRMNEEGEEQPVEVGMVEKGLEAVAKTVFPYRALENQKAWMRKRLQKPQEMTTRKLLAAINRLNNYLPRFPAAPEKVKFSKEEILEILEWSLPDSWRKKFDKEQYIPSQGTVAELLAACEALERTEEDEPKEPPSGAPKKSKRTKGASKQKSTAKKAYFCKLHGKNTTHNSEDCFTLKKKQNKSPAQGQKPETAGKRTFSKKAFRKEINVLSKAKNSSKNKVLDSLEELVKEERAKLKALHNKAKKAQAERKANSERPTSSSSESEPSVSDSDVSVHVLDAPIPRKKRRTEPSSLVTEKWCEKLSGRSTEEKTVVSAVNKRNLDKKTVKLKKHLNERFKSLGKAIKNKRPQEEEEKDDDEPEVIVAEKPEEMDTN